MATAIVTVTGLGLLVGFFLEIDRPPDVYGESLNAVRARNMRAMAGTAGFVMGLVAAGTVYVVRVLNNW